MKIKHFFVGILSAAMIAACAEGAYSRLAESEAEESVSLDEAVVEVEIAGETDLEVDLLPASYADPEDQSDIVDLDWAADAG